MQAGRFIPERQPTTTCNAQPSPAATASAPGQSGPFSLVQRQFLHCLLGASPVVSQSDNCGISERYGQRAFKSYSDCVTPPNRDCTSGLLQCSAWLHCCGAFPWTKRTTVTKHSHGKQNLPFPNMYHLMKTLERECFWSLAFCCNSLAWACTAGFNSIYSFLLPPVPTEFPFWNTNCPNQLNLVVEEHKLWRGVKCQLLS